ncbi:MAG TPA: antibiotic biosynthesis monooxygenase [Ktedonobacteraceae bacterium]
MYARVVTTQYQPGKLDEGLQIYRDSIVPAARQTQGFKGALGLVDRSTGKAISIGLRETAADMQATESSGFVQEQFAKGMHLLAGTPTVEVYEVSIQETQQGGAGSYARVLSSTVKPGKTDELIQIARDSILPVARQQGGSLGMLLLNDRTTGKGISITLWATEADMKASETSGYLREQLTKLTDVLASQVVREAYEVALQV